MRSLVMEIRIEGFAEHGLGGSGGGGCEIGEVGRDDLHLGHPGQGAEPAEVLPGLGFRFGLKDDGHASGYRRGAESQAIGVLHLQKCAFGVPGVGGEIDD